MKPIRTLSLKRFSSYIISPFIISPFIISPFIISLLAIFFLTACESLNEITQTITEDLPVIGEDIQYPCPVVATPAETTFITKYQGAQKRDLTDISFEASIHPRELECEWDINSRIMAGMLKVKVTPYIKASQGKANQDGRLDVSYYLALADADNNILSKDVFPMSRLFPASNHETSFPEPQISLQIPVAPNETDRDFRIYLGFNLTPQEYEHNLERYRNQLR